MATLTQPMIDAGITALDEQKFYSAALSITDYQGNTQIFNISSESIPSIITQAQALKTSLTTPPAEDSNT